MHLQTLLNGGSLQAHTCGHSRSLPSRPQPVPSCSGRRAEQHASRQQPCRRKGRRSQRLVPCRAQDTETEADSKAEPQHKDEGASSSPPASNGNGSEPHTSAAEAQEDRDTIAATLRGLDALLGIEEEAKKDDTPRATPGPAKVQSEGVEVDDNVLRQLAEAEVKRGDSDKKGDDYERLVQETLERLKNVYATADKVRKASDGGQNPQQILAKEMEKLMEKLEPGTKADIAKIKDKVFGSQVFWVTETRPEIGRVTGSYLIRGNLRCPQDQAFAKVEEGLTKLFGDKYTAFMVPDPDKLELSENDGGRERIAFRITPTKFALPQPNVPWQVAVAVLLLIFTAGTSFQIGLAANASRLPENIVNLLQTSEALDAETIPPELASFDFLPFLLSSLPIAGSIFGTQFAHELGHRVAANLRNVKLGVPFFVPNGQIGVFGAVTQFKSLIRTRTGQLDIAAAGPVAGGIVSAALFAAGLFLSKGSQDQLLPIPAALLSDSLLLGSVTKAALAPSGSMQSVFVHPYVIGGWCGLVATALNCLPAGCLDGGRIMQAAFGRQSLNISSIFVYVALVTGLLGNTLSLPFALYIFILQREQADSTQDTVTAPDSVRKGLALGIILVSLLILLPLATGGDPTNPPSISL